MTRVYFGPPEDKKRFFLEGGMVYRRFQNGSETPGNRIHLDRTAFGLLSLFLSSGKDHLISSDKMVDELRGVGKSIDSTAFAKKYVSVIREQLDREPSCSAIGNERARGWYFNWEITRNSEGPPASLPAPSHTERYLKSLQEENTYI